MKQKEYQPTSGVSTLLVRRISRVQATQRAGRAGRTAPGKCFRLYGAREMKRMDERTSPEIMRVSLESVVLHLKVMSYDDVLDFDFLDAPDSPGLVAAAVALFLLGALDADGKLTSQGRLLSTLPTEPAYGKVLLAACKGGAVAEVVTVVAILAGTDSLFRQAARGNAGDKHPHARFVCDGLGDHIAFLRAYAEWSAQPGQQQQAWCRQHCIDGRCLRTARQTRDLLLRSLQPAFADALRDGDERRIRFDSERLSRVRQSLCYGMYTHAACSTRRGGYMTMGEPKQLGVCPDAPWCAFALPRLWCLRLC